MLINRKKYLNKIESAIKTVPITILIGARQTGKTSLLESFKSNYTTFGLDGQLPDTNNLFNDINDVISFLKIKLNENLDGLLVIDEFQMINNISSSLKILVDNFKSLKILCSGSSSIDIVQKTKESLAGRVRMIYVNSLSFSETVLFKNNLLFNDYETFTKDTNHKLIPPEIKQVLNEQLIYGGMPRICLTKNTKEKIRISDDIYKTYLLRDIRAYVKTSDSVGFNKLLQLLALQIGNLVNINELSRSSGLSYHKCEEYLYLLEQMFIIKLIEPYETNKRKAIKKMKKVFFLDLGIRNIIVKNFNPPDLRTDSGALFENFVFLEILKSVENYTTIQFFRTRDGAEVDFVINNLFEKITVEVKHKILKKPTFYKALTGFNTAENISKSYVVNLELNQKENIIHYIPACLFEKIFT
ncbi:MAG: ATP-binding protein [Chlorobi bacterium]|nr:ATP-binding protein [Chlorobiota bacterium]